jgi:hypothetical protein
MGKDKKHHISILEAVDNLSHLVEPTGSPQSPETVKQTFSAINSYLHHLYYKEREELKEVHTQKGLQAMMQLAKEAATKYADFMAKKEESLPEYQQLQHFYLSKVFSQVKQGKSHEAWENEGLEPELYAERQALKDLEMVQHDREYELFYIGKEDGTPFFTPHLLRHAAMVAGFDETLLEHENFFEKIDVILDRDVHVSAQEMLHAGADLIDRFFKEALAHKEQKEIGHLIAALMALMLCSNPKNLTHNTTGKSATHYFEDFQVYLRLVVSSDTYGKWKKEKASFKALCLKLTHFLCSAYFLKVGARHDIVRVIHDVVQKAHEGKTIGGYLLEADELMRAHLRQFPSGPLLKTVELFRQGKERSGFDPLMQKNLPAQIFTISSESLHTSVIHLPCPIHQDFIEKATIVPEFKAYLESLSGRKLLYFNLQDRTSWKEHARAEEIENLEQEVFCPVTYAKGTDFYHQKEEYENTFQADVFCRLFTEQILSGKESGFYFPQGVIGSDIVSGLITFVHETLFDGKRELNRKERLDFIEILYFFLSLKILEKEKADVMAFSCKDGVDVGAAAAGSFYGFSRLLSSSKPWSPEDKTCFLFAFFAPALFVRHRTIAPLVFQRAVSALDYFDQVMQEKRHAVLKACAKLFAPLEKIKVGEVA